MSSRLLRGVAVIKLRGLASSSGCVLARATSSALLIYQDESHRMLLYERKSETDVKCGK